MEQELQKANCHSHLSKRGSEWRQAKTTGRRLASGVRNKASRYPHTKQLSIVSVKPPRALQRRKRRKKIE